MSYQLYTDGATSKNGTKDAIGGWAYIALKDDKIIDLKAEQLSPATNNICELTAILKGCEFLLPQLETFDIIEVYSDSAYCINCVNQHWYGKWRQNGWINSSKQPVKNKEIWEQLIPFFDDPRFRWIKVKGHADNKWNNLVDRLAVDAKVGIMPYLFDKKSNSYFFRYDF